MALLKRFYQQKWMSSSAYYTAVYIKPGSTVMFDKWRAYSDICASGSGYDQLLITPETPTTGAHTQSIDIGLALKDDGQTWHYENISRTITPETPTTGAHTQSINIGLALKDDGQKWHYENISRTI